MKFEVGQVYKNAYGTIVEIINVDSTYVTYKTKLCYESEYDSFCSAKQNVENNLKINGYELVK